MHNPENVYLIYDYDQNIISIAFLKNNLIEKENNIPIYYRSKLLQKITNKYFFAPSPKILTIKTMTLNFEILPLNEQHKLKRSIKTLGMKWNYSPQKT